MMEDSGMKTGGTFPLRLMASVRRAAAEWAEAEGVSLNQFIHLAVAEKVAHLEHDAWMRRRKRPSAAGMADGLRVLEVGGEEEMGVGDELPEGYLGVRGSG